MIEMMQQLWQAEGRITEEEDGMKASKQKRLQLLKQLVHASPEILAMAIAMENPASAHCVSRVGKNALDSCFECRFHVLPGFLTE